MPQPNRRSYGTVEKQVLFTYCYSTESDHFHHFLTKLEVRPVHWAVYFKNKMKKIYIRIYVL